MTLKDRVDKLVDELFPYASFEEHCCASDIIRRAMIEQDKITRQAAAEEVAMLSPTINQTSTVSYVSKAAAHSAVMNCNGGVE